MENEKIKIQNKVYRYLECIEKISIADSFVLPSNKINGGNGEAKLYVGQVGERLIDFFGKRGFKINCFLTQNNLLDYLNKAYSEYIEPTQRYRDKGKLAELWKERYQKVSNLPSFIPFCIEDQIQIEGPRLYVNAAQDIIDKERYKLLREIPLPIISYLNIYKLQYQNNIYFYFHIYLFDENVTLSDISEEKVKLNETERFIPGAEDIEADVEKELPAYEPIIIKTPFDPNKIRVRTAPSSIGQIIDDLEDGIINLDTEFQRLPDLWNDEKKSRFIESLLLKLPIPAFYFNEKEENDLEVVDGLQRISTIKSFVIKENFKLKNLEFLKEYNGCFYSNLPSTFQRRIKTFHITTYVIEKGTPDEVKFNIFKRVNTGGLTLTDQEIRHAINQGKPAELIADLARGEDIFDDETGNLKKRSNADGTEVELLATREGIAFVKATDNRIGSFRMEDRDFITRFVAFYLTSYEDYEPSLDTFLNSGMAKIRNLTNDEIVKLKNDFYKSMNLAYIIFGRDAFRKRFNKNDARKPINKALFETLSVSLALLDDNETALLEKRKDIFINKFISLHQNSTFLRAISQGTAIKDSVTRRFKDITQIIKETLYD